MTDRDSLRAQLEALGEDAVRARLTEGVYGDRKRRYVEAWLREQEQKREAEQLEEERSSRHLELAVATSSSRAGWVSATFAGASMLVSVAAFAVSWIALARSDREVVDVMFEASQSDYPSRFVTRGLPGMRGLFDAYWSCTLINNGDRTVSVLDLDLKQVEAQGLVMYSQMNGGTYDAAMSPVTFPLSIEPGQSRRLLIKVRVPLDSTAAAVLSQLFPDSLLPSLRIAVDSLADRGIDLFGDRVEPMRDGRRIIGFKVIEMTKEPRFLITVTTGRGLHESAIAGWYPSVPQ